MAIWRSDRAGDDIKTARSRRTLKLPEIALSALRERKAAQVADRLKTGELWQDSGLVFTTPLGTMLDQHNIRREFRQITKAAGLGEDWVPRTRGRPRSRRRSAVPAGVRLTAPSRRSQVGAGYRHRDPEEGDGGPAAGPGRRHPHPPARARGRAGQPRGSGYPFVVVDPRTALAPDIAAVSAAHFPAPSWQPSTCSGSGHSRIAAIAGPLNWITTDGRLMGYRAALAADGRLAPEELVRLGGEPTLRPRPGGGAPCSRCPSRRPPSSPSTTRSRSARWRRPPSGASGFRPTCRSWGFDDLDLSRAVVSRMTTVRQPLEEMARMGVELLLRLIDGREIDTLHIELATEFVVRASTGPPRRGT